MTITETIQEKNFRKEKILENLNLLSEKHNFSQVEICRKLGYEKDAFSKLKSDEHYFGSKQLLAGMKILLELETLKQDKIEIDKTRSALQHLLAPTAPFLMNDAPNKIETVAQKEVSYRKSRAASEQVTAHLLKKVQRAARSKRNPKA